MTDIDYAARVARGVALMDKKWPNWATEIDVDRLDINSSWDCVTAQYAQRRDADFSWLDGMDMLGLDRVSYREHGFNGEEDPEGGIVPPAAYAALNGLWRAEIERRRAQAEQAPAEPEETP